MKKKIKNSTKVLFFKKAHKFLVYVVLLMEYVLHLDFINRLNIENDEMWFSCVGLAFIFTLMSGVIYWLVFGDDLNTRITKVYLMHKRIERQAMMDKIERRRNEKLEKQAEINRKKFEEFEKSRGEV